MEPELGGGEERPNPDMMPSGMTPDWIEGWQIRQLVEGRIIVELPFSRNGRTQYVFEAQDGLYDLLRDLLEGLDHAAANSA